MDRDYKFSLDKFVTFAIFILPHYATLFFWKKSKMIGTKKLKISTEKYRDKIFSYSSR